LLQGSPPTETRSVGIDKENPRNRETGERTEGKEIETERVRERERERERERGRERDREESLRCERRRIGARL